MRADGPRCAGWARRTSWSGIPSFGNADTIGYVVRAATAGMVQYFTDLKPVLVNADGGSADDTPRVAVTTESPDYLEQMILIRPPHRLRRIAVTYRGASGKGSAVRALLEVARELKVEALVLVDSDLRSIVPEWIELLAGPILKGGYDYVAPLYARHKYDGTITNHIAYPLTRTLYGRRLRQPIGGEFAISRDLVKALLELPDWDEGTARFGIDIWMTHHALAGGFAVCQTRLGAKVHDPKDPAGDLGPMFRQVVGTLFRLAGEQAAEWLPIRGSEPVPEYGFERVIAPGADHRGPGRAGERLRQRAAGPGTRCGSGCWPGSSWSGSGPCRWTTRRPSPSPRSCGSAACSTPCSPSSAPGWTARRCWPG